MSQTESPQPNPDRDGLLVSAAIVALAVEIAIQFPDAREQADRIVELVRRSSLGSCPDRAKLLATLATHPPRLSVEEIFYGWRPEQFEPAADAIRRLFEAR